MKYPKTRYQGSKLKIINFLEENLSNIKYKTVLDAFSGSSTVGLLFKSKNKVVYSNDILKCNYYISKALVGNNDIKIETEDINRILYKDNNFKYDTFIFDNFKDIYYLDEENEWLDIITQNILREKNEIKKSMFFWALFQAALSKRPYNLFHRKNLYARTRNVKRSFGNKTTWDKPFEVHFIKFIEEINNIIFDSKKEHFSYCGDVLDFDLTKHKIDLIYMDPPYISKSGIGVNYFEFYHFLDGLIDYYNWGKLIDFNTINKKLKKDNKILWNDKKTILKEFEKVIAKFKESNFAISYRDDGIPSIEEIVYILKKHTNKEIFIKEKEHTYVLSKNKTTKEILIYTKEMKDIY
jgi:adenine-specific DNA methylase